MQPLDDRTTCYTLIFRYFETADPTRPDPTRGSTRPVYNSGCCVLCSCLLIVGGPIFDLSVCYLFLQYFDTVGWVF